MWGASLVNTHTPSTTAADADLLLLPLAVSPGTALPSDATAARSLVTSSRAAASSRNSSCVRASKPEHSLRERERTYSLHD